MRAYYGGSTTCDNTNCPYSNIDRVCDVTSKPTYAPSVITPSPTMRPTEPATLYCDHSGWYTELQFPGAVHDWAFQLPYGYSSIKISTCLSQTQIAATLKLYDSTKNTIIDSDTDGSGVTCGSNKPSSEIKFTDASFYYTPGNDFVVEIGGYLGDYGQYGINVTCYPHTPSPTDAPVKIDCDTVNTVYGNIDSEYESDTFIFTLPTDLRSVEFSTCDANTDFDTQLTLYDDNEQHYIAGNDDYWDINGAACNIGYNNRSSLLKFDILNHSNYWWVGNDYVLKLGSRYSVQGSYGLSVSCTSLPETITCNSGTISGGITSGTRKQYLFTLPLNIKSMQFSTCNTGTTIDTHLYLWNSLAMTNSITDNDDYNTSLHSCAVLDGIVTPSRASIIDFYDSPQWSGYWNPNPGYTGYVLEVAGYNDVQTGNYELTITCEFDSTSQPTINPTAITGIPTSPTAVPIVATVISVECGDIIPNLSIDVIGGSTLFSIVTTDNIQSVIFSTCDTQTTLDTNLYLYTGSDASGNYILENDDFGNTNGYNVSELCNGLSTTTASEILISENTFGSFHVFSQYTLKVTEFNNDERGDYKLHVVCQYYPTDEPSGVPSGAPTRNQYPTSAKTETSQVIVDETKTTDVGQGTSINLGLIWWIFMIWRILCMKQ
eukprot:257403_1